MKHALFFFLYKSCCCILILSFFFKNKANNIIYNNKLGPVVHWTILLMKSRSNCSLAHCVVFVFLIELLNSLPDLSIPEIVKQFNERQSQKKKPRRRPHSSSIYTSSTKSAAIVDERNGKKTSYNYDTFITGAEKCLLLCSLCLAFYQNRWSGNSQNILQV